MKEKIVIFSGAGVSQESGIDTFRDEGGIWDKYDLEKVATLKGWEEDREYVLDFYNLARRECLKVKPNKAHYGLASLEKDYDVVIITQNIDELHENAGSTNVIHLHGNIFEAKSSNPKYSSNIIRIENDINIGDKSEDGAQLRPNVVWFGEDVPNMIESVKEVMSCDKLIVIGTSLDVFPANQLLNYVKLDCEVFLIDPNPPINIDENVIVINKKATEGVEFLINHLN